MPDVDSGSDLAERDKRLRKEGNDQYVKIFQDERFAGFLGDPYTPFVERAPVVETEANDVLLLGGGFSSLLCGAKLRGIGVKTIRMVEEGGGLGGT